jgi:hypothetical protein
MAKRMWTVHLEQAPRNNPWPLGYFPRTFYYRRDAVECLKRIEEYGGKGVIK